MSTSAHGTSTAPARRHRRPRPEAKTGDRPERRHEHSAGTQAQKTRPRQDRGDEEQKPKPLKVTPHEYGLSTLAVLAYARCNVSKFHLRATRACHRGQRAKGRSAAGRRPYRTAGLLRRGRLPFCVSGAGDSATLPRSSTMNAEEMAIWEARWLRATAGDYTTQGEWTRYFDADSGMPFYCKLLALCARPRSPENVRPSHPTPAPLAHPSPSLAHPSTALLLNSLRSQGKTPLPRRLGSSRPFPPPPHGWKPRRARGARCGGSSATPRRVASWRVPGSRPGPSSRRRPRGRGPSLPSLQGILFRRGRQ